MGLMKNGLLLTVLLVLAASGSVACLGPTLAAEAPASGQVFGGRVVDIQVDHGFLIAEFPSGRMFVGMDKRELGSYIIGDEIRIDTFGRPLPRRVVR
jgi:hypothetical protein